MPPRSRRIERRTRYTRTGDRPIRINSPDGWMTNPAIPQPYSGFPNPGFHWLGSDTISGLIGPGEKLAAATRALELVAGSIAGMPWTVRRGETEMVAAPEWISDPQLLRLDGRIASSSFANWQNRLSAVAFREQLVTSLLLWGDAFLLTPVRDVKGAPQPPIFLLHPQDVDAKDGGYWVGQERLPDRSVIHIRGRGPLDDQGRGQGVLQAHAASLGLLSAAVTKASQALTAPIPAGVLEVASGYSITPDEATQLRSDWEMLHSGKYGIGVLNATTTFKPLSWSPEALQLVELADFGIREVALAFGISPSWLGVPDSSLTYNTVVLKAIELRTFTLLSWVRRIESAIDSELARGTELSIVMDGLERADTESRYRAYDVAIKGGWMTADEARRLEGWQPLQVEVPDE